jgi:hypothetical protein
MIQEGQSAQRKQVELAAGLERIGRELLGDASPCGEIAWLVIPRGFGFTAGAPSTASLVVRSVPAGFPDVEREALQSRISELWVNVTGCTADEVVVTAFDGPLPPI